jgi:hypothetical protein
MTTNYATQNDVVSVGLQANVLARCQPSQVAACLKEAADEADGHFRGRWGYTAVPLLAWDSAVTGATARLAAFKIVCVAGINPDSQDYKLARQMFADAMEFFNAVQRQQMHPNVTLASGALPGQQQPNVVSFSVVNLATGGTAPNRGW